MAKNKTTENNRSVAGFLKTIKDEKKRKNCSEIIELITKNTASTDISVSVFVEEGSGWYWSYRVAALALCRASHGHARYPHWYTNCCRHHHWYGHVSSFYRCRRIGRVYCYRAGPQQYGINFTRSHSCGCVSDCSRISF